MRERSIVVDVSIDRGVFETSRLTSHERPTFIECGVIHYCVPNIPSRVSRTASGEQHFGTLLLGIAGGGVVPAIKDHNPLPRGCTCSMALDHEEIAAERNCRGSRSTGSDPLTKSRVTLSDFPWTTFCEGCLDFVQFPRLHRREVVDVDLHDDLR